MTRLSDDALAELARLASEATPGPWYWPEPGLDDAPMLSADGTVIIVMAWHDGCGDYAVPDAADRAYIGAADPSTVAALVAEVRELRAEIAFWIERDNDPAF